MRLRDGSIEQFDDPKATLGAAIGPGFVGVGGKFDLTDLVVRALGKSPYRYEHQRLADSTREERISQIIESTRLDTRQALFDLQARVNSILDGDMPLAQQHKVLFELWDECTESDEGKSAGATARVIIESLIRKRMPAGKETSFTAAELETLNQQRNSGERFDPYEERAHSVSNQH